MDLKEFETCDLVEELYNRNYDFLKDEDTDELASELSHRGYNFLSEEPTENLIYALEDEGYIIHDKDDNSGLISEEDLKRMVEILDSNQYEVGDETHLLRERLHEILHW